MGRKRKPDDQEVSTAPAPEGKTNLVPEKLVSRLRERPSRAVTSPQPAKTTEKNKKTAKPAPKLTSPEKSNKAQQGFGKKAASPASKSNKAPEPEPKKLVKETKSTSKKHPKESKPNPSGEIEEAQLPKSSKVAENGNHLTIQGGNDADEDEEMEQMLSKRNPRSLANPPGGKKLSKPEHISAIVEHPVLGLSISIPQPSLMGMDSTRLTTPPPTPSLTQQATTAPSLTAANSTQQFWVPTGQPAAGPRQVKASAMQDEDDEDDDMMQMLDRSRQTDSAKKQAPQPVVAAPVTPKHLNFTNEDFVHEKSQRVDDAYYFMKPPIGSGLFGAVYRAKHKKSGVIRAIKRIKKDHVNGANLQSLLNDVDILKKLDHPNIIKVYEFYQDEAAYYVVTDLCTGGELFEKIVQEKIFTEKQAAEYMRQILSAIAYCHEKQLVHCDLKPENIMLESPNSSLIKIIDFGNSSICTKDQRLTNKFGSVYYVAPEVLNSSYDEKCDVWSLGVILYLLLTGKPPFNGNSDQQILQKVYAGTYTMDIPEMAEISAAAKDLIKKMLTFKMDDRITAKECLNHPWIKQEGKVQELSTHSTINRRSLRNLKTFRSESMLQEAVMYFIVNQLTGKEEREDLMNVFMSLDSDHDGKLTRADLIEGYLNMGEDPSTVEVLVDEILKNVDKNEKGFIDYSEYVTVALSKRKLFSEEKLSAAFKIFGGDDKGYIDAEDFKNTLCKGAFAAVEENVWGALINEVAGEEGHITFESFKKMMTMFTANEQVTQSLAL